MPKFFRAWGQSANHEWRASKAKALNLGFIWIGCCVRERASQSVSQSVNQSESARG
jgi:hypothetical protein